VNALSAICSFGMLSAAAAYRARAQFVKVVLHFVLFSFLFAVAAGCVRCCALEAKYTGCVVDLESLPSMPFLNIVKTQHDNKAWDWLPWKKVLSEKVASALKDKKPALGPLEVLCGANVEEQLDRELSNQPFPILQTLTVRGHAYAMVGSGHLGSWTLYNNRFMKFYTQVPGPHLRFCSAQEAEEADQAAMREVFNLCYAGSSIDDA
jgi:hypothetical protein